MSTIMSQSFVTVPLFTFVLFIAITSLCTQVIFGSYRIEGEIIYKYGENIIIKTDSDEIKTVKAFEYTLKEVEIGKRYLLIKSEGAASIAKELPAK